jgi:hypothetical protein
MDPFKLPPNHTEVNGYASTVLFYLISSGPCALDRLAEFGQHRRKITVKHQKL